MRTLALFSTLLALAACGSGGDPDPSASADTADTAAPPAAAAPAPATPTQPGADTAWVLRMDGMGPLRIGMTVDEARAALGGDLRLSDDVVGTDGGPDRCQYPASGRLLSGVLVMLEGQRIVRIQVDSGSAATAEGARIGDPESRIQQLYAGRVTVQPHKYTDGHYLVVRPAEADTTRLLIFETDGQAVQRFRAGQRPQVEYVEGCS